MHFVQISMKKKLTLSNLRERKKTYLGRYIIGNVTAVSM